MKKVKVKVKTAEKLDRNDFYKFLQEHDGETVYAELLKGSNFIANIKGKLHYRKQEFKIVSNTGMIFGPLFLYNVEKWVAPGKKDGIKAEYDGITWTISI